MVLVRTRIRVVASSHIFAHSWKSLKCEALTDVYSITYARVRIVYDKSYREDRPLGMLWKSVYLNDDTSTLTSEESPGNNSLT